jgi:Tfp pilus assembly protein PilN
MEIKLNLLSGAKKDEMHRRKRYRFIVLQEIIILLLLALYAGILFGINKMMSLQIENSSMSIISDDQKNNLRIFDEFEKKFQSTNDTVSSMLHFQQEHITWSSALFALNDIVPEGIVFEKIVTVDKRISLSGIADTRDHLIQFQSKFNASDCFQNIKVPLSDLFVEKDIDFQIDFDVQKNCIKKKKL